MQDPPEVVSAGRLAADLRTLGLRDGDAVLVHSSLSGLGWVEVGADTVVDALLVAVGDTGTVLFPTLTGAERDGPNHPPVIRLASTPCWTGAIPEAGRTRPEAIRSIHPTHSVSAIGARAKDFTRGHETSRTPCDAQSPYMRLMDEGGKILFLGGVTHASNTSLHALEELAEVPYHLQDEVTEGVVILPDGRRVIVRNRLHLWRWERNFTRVVEPLEASGAQVSAPVGASRATLVSASGLRDTLMSLLREHPLYLLAETSRTAFQDTQVP